MGDTAGVCRHLGRRAWNAVSTTEDHEQGQDFSGKSMVEWKNKQNPLYRILAREHHQADTHAEDGTESCRGDLLYKGKGTAKSCDGCRIPVWIKARHLHLTDIT